MTAVNQVRGRDYSSGEAIELTWQGDRITERRVLRADTDTSELPWIIPGLFDIQLNGYGGRWFSSDSLTVEDVCTIVHELARNGIARQFPTLITNSFEALEHGFRTIAEACRSDALTDTLVAGCHLEGPAISQEDGPRGAHPLKHVRPPDAAEFSRLQNASGNRIRLVTMAAEAPGADTFIRSLRSEGVIVSLGHMAADSAQIAAAVSAGAAMSTHLGNGAHAMLPRHPNYIWDQLAADDLWCGLITDGHHLPAAFVKCALRCKGTERVIVTCDVSGFGGCEPGRYSEGNVEVEVLTDGRIVVADQRKYLAGSSAVTGDCLAWMIGSGLADLPDAVRMTSLNPRRLFGAAIPGRLQPGEPADLTVFRLIQEDPRQGDSGDTASESIVTFLPVATVTGGISVGLHGV